MTRLLRDVRNKDKATADPPFDFAQGRLFGDDNKRTDNDKCNNNDKCNGNGNNNGKCNGK
jgi:hypothetical protein